MDDTIDLCSDGGQSPKHDTVKEFDFVGSLSDCNSDISTQNWDSNDTIPWKSSPQRNSISPDDVIALDSDDDRTVQKNNEKHTSFQSNTYNKSNNIFTRKTDNENSSFKLKSNSENIHNSPVITIESDIESEGVKNDDIFERDTDLQSNVDEFEYDDLTSKFNINRKQILDSGKVTSPNFDCDDEFVYDGLTSKLDFNRKQIQDSDKFTLPNFDCDSGDVGYASLPSCANSQGSSGVERKGRGGKRKNEREEQEKRERKRILNEAKALRPGECMKYMIVECGEDLRGEECFSQVESVLGASGVGSVNYQGGRGCVSWRRKPPSVGGQPLLFPTTTKEPHVAVVLQEGQAVELLKSRSLGGHIKSMCAGGEYNTITLLLYGMEEYFRKHKCKEKAVWRENVEQGRAMERHTTTQHITRNDLDYYLTKLLIEDQISCHRAETPQELGHTLLCLTKAVAEAPHKRARQAQDHQVDFYMRGDNRDCVRVDAQGNGLLRLWSQSLCKFPLAGLEVGQAVCERWRSPRELCKALGGQGGGLGGAVELLGGVPVRRGRGGSKRLGPELAKKLYTYFTATEGDTML